MLAPVMVNCSSWAQGRWILDGDGGEPWRSKQTLDSRGELEKVVMGGDADADADEAADGDGNDADSKCWMERDRDSRFVNSASDREKNCASWA